MTPVPAITLWQPWASLVAVGAKTSETRSWRPPASLVGEGLAIHAAARPPRLSECPPGVSWPWTQGLPLGAVVATATLVDAFEVDTFTMVGGQCWKGGCGISSDPAGYISREVRVDGLGHYAFGRWVRMLADVVALDEPIPARGRQGIWYWSGS